MLDAVEHGETIRITRGGRPVAELRPVAGVTGRDLRTALIDAPTLDEEFADDIAAALALTTNEINGSWPDS